MLFEYSSWPFLAKQPDHETSLDILGILPVSGKYIVGLSLTPVCVRPRVRRFPLPTEA